VIFDRSWYNWAGVEHVKSCTEKEGKRFLSLVPQVEVHALQSGETPKERQGGT
jgi:polyphosphate kinase 2 (PPK2 family)